MTQQRPTLRIARSRDEQEAEGRGPAADPRLYIGRETEAAAPRSFGFGTSPEARKTARLALISDGTDAGLVTIAGTGAGKGVGQVIPACLSYKGSIVVNDPKGEIYAVTARRRREMGQRVVRIDPFGGGETQSINPISLMDPFSETAIDDALQMARQITGKGSHHDPFWDQQAERLIAGSILFIATHLPRGSRRLEILRRIWFAGEETLGDILACMLASELHGGFIHETAQLYLSAPDKTRSSILSSVQEKLMFLSSPRGLRSLARNEMDLAAYRDGEPMTVYLRLPPHLGGSQAPLLRLWLGTLIQTAARRERRPEVPDLFLIDEAAQMGGLDELLMAASLLRGYGVRTWTFWQSIGQMEALYGLRSREFLDNAGTLSMFGASNAACAEAIRNLTGYEGTLLGMKPGTQVIARSGESARLAARLDYRREPEFFGLWDENPFHAPPGPARARAGETR